MCQHHLNNSFTVVINTYTTSFSLLDGDIGWLLVQSNTDTLQFVGQDSQIVQGLQYVEHDEDQIACSGNC